MPITSTSGFDISSDTCCSPISASPLETSTLTRPLGPPAASLTFGATSAAMPSFANTPMTWAAVTPPPAGAVWVMDFAASRRRHVGLGRALAHGDADAGARDVRAAAHDLALLDQLVERLAVHDDEIDRLAGVQAAGEPAGGSIGDAEHVPIGALERRRELVDRRLHGGGDHGVDLGGVRRARGHDQRSRGRDRACAHDTSSYHAGSSPFAL